MTRIQRCDLWVPATQVSCRAVGRCAGAKEHNSSDLAAKS